MFGFIQVKLTKIPKFGFFLKFSLYKITVCSGFGLDRFHCINYGMEFFL